MKFEIGDRVRVKPGGLNPMSKAAITAGAEGTVTDNFGEMGAEGVALSVLAGLPADPTDEMLFVELDDVPHPSDDRNYWAFSSGQVEKINVPVAA